MKERPILFSAAMVRALLAGTKTQTRRIVKPVKFYPDFGCAVGQVGGAWKYGSPAALGLRERGDHWSVVLKGDVLQRMCTSEAYGWGAGAGCPYGVPGDRLWVRETFARIDGQTRPWIETDYQATYTHGDRLGDTLGIKKRWTPSIHMPRHASRITLEITAVRVERLQDISEADARAEGARECDPVSGREVLLAGPSQRGSFVLHYRDIWEQINGPCSWDANPWVWAIEFRRLP